ncbi:hypothetical protein BC940DRAFT_313604 [Gongronella butleri]|nr:hypothetical protein BC940DRAFT_313604 [Gongronella butleri]
MPKAKKQANASGGSGGKKETRGVGKASETSPLPPIPKLMPKTDGLAVTELEPQQIYLVHDLFTPNECQKLIDYFEQHLKPQAVASLVPKPGEAFRSNDRQSMQSPVLAKLLWQLGVARACEHEGIVAASGPRTPCGLNSNIRIYRYRPGQRFEAHYDDTVKDDVTGYWTDWTLLIYLNGDMQGGETVFYRDHGAKKKKTTKPPIVVQPKQGLALLHRHGQHCLLHEALEVTRGNKWVLRSDVLIR